MATGILTRYGNVLGTGAGGTYTPPPPPPPPPGVTGFVVVTSTIAPNPIDPGATLTWTVTGLPRSDGSLPTVGTVTDSDGRTWTVTSRTPTTVVLQTTVIA